MHVSIHLEVVEGQSKGNEWIIVLVLWYSLARDRPTAIVPNLWSILLREWPARNIWKVTERNQCLHTKSAPNFNKFWFIISLAVLSVSTVRCSALELFLSANISSAWAIIRDSIQIWVELSFFTSLGDRSNWLVTKKQTASFEHVV